MRWWRGRQWRQSKVRVGGVRGTRCCAGGCGCAAATLPATLSSAPPHVSRLAHPLQQLVHALAEAPAVREVAGAEVCTEGLVDEVSVQVDTDGVGGRGGEGHRLLQAVEVEAPRDDLRGGPQVVSPVGIHGGELVVVVGHCRRAGRRAEAARLSSGGGGGARGKAVLSSLLVRAGCGCPDPCATVETAVLAVCASRLAHRLARHWGHAAPISTASVPMVGAPAPAILHGAATVGVGRLKLEEGRQGSKGRRNRHPPWQRARVVDYRHTGSALERCISVTDLFRV